MSASEDQIVMLSNMEHISELDILLYLGNKLSGKHLLDMEAHLAECDDCLEKLANIRELQKRIESDSFSPAVDSDLLKKTTELVGSSKNDNPPWISAPSLSFAPTVAAIIFFAVFVTAINFSSWSLRKAPESFRSLDASQSVQLVHPEDAGGLSNEHPVFSWVSVDNAVSYQLMIFLENGSPFWQTTLTNTSVVLPSDVTLMPGHRYLWHIEVFMPDKQTIRSKLGSFVYLSNKTN